MASWLAPKKSAYGFETKTFLRLLQCARYGYTSSVGLRSVTDTPVALLSKDSLLVSLARCTQSSLLSAHQLTTHSLTHSLTSPDSHTRHPSSTPFIMCDSKTDDEVPDPDFKVILLGDSAVGKSKLVERYLMDDYNPRQVCVLVCVCERERERVCVCVCVSE